MSIDIDSTINTAGTFTLSTIAEPVPESNVESVVDKDGTARPVPAHPRITFPEVPGLIRDHYAVPDSAEPRVDRRWQRVKIGGMQIVDLLWYGPCLYCNRGVWADEDRAANGNMVRESTLRVWEQDGREYRFCDRCATSTTRIEAAIQSRGHEYTAPYTWPQSVIDKIKTDPERTRLSRLTAVVPVVPRVGALIRAKAEDETLGVTGKLFTFAGFENGQVTTTKGETFPIEAVEALVPAFPGIKYERATAMPALGKAGRLVEITGWSSNAPRVREAPDGASRTGWSPTHVAALAPVLDPSTETPEQTIARLTLAQERLEYGIHSRMVAEATARSWCAEFDAIIDSTGLPPRQSRGLVRGTITFEHTFGNDVDQATLDGIKGRWFDYIPHASTTCVEVELVTNEKRSLITPV